MTNLILFSVSWSLGWAIAHAFFDGSPDYENLFFALASAALYHLIWVR